MLNEEAYVQRRMEGWSRLEGLTVRAETSFKKLSGLEVVEYVRLYRRTSADLAYLMTHSSNRELVDSLNRLVGRAYGQLYRTPITPLMKFIDNALYSAASTFRKYVIWFWVACAITGLAIAFSGILMTLRPDLRHHFVDPSMEQNFDYWKSGQHEARSGDEGIGATAMYVTNNPRVGIMTVAFGAATAGVGTVYILWGNGIILGALGSDMLGVGKLGFLLSSIAPHGVSEIGGIFVGAMAGFVFGWAFLRPGNRKRGDALMDAGKDAFVLFMLALVAIALAAPIEGFFSFNPSVPQWVKVIFAGLALAAWTTYLARYGLDRDREKMRELTK